MLEQKVFEDIAERTGGGLWICVTGPVRTGKSALIGCLARALVLPHAEESAGRACAEALPPTGEGRTVRTLSPVNVPEEAVQIPLAGGGELGVRFTECVGFPADGAEFGEEGAPQVVLPFSGGLPFGQAADALARRTGNAALLVTSDGSVTQLAREALAAAEEGAVRALRAAEKPFVILVNSRAPRGEACGQVCAALAERYGVPALPFDCEKAGEEEISELFERLLFEFPVTRIDFDLPGWLCTLPEDSPAVAEALGSIRAVCEKIVRLGDGALVERMFEGSDRFASPASGELFPGSGRARYAVSAREGTFYKVLGEACGAEIADDVQLMAYMRSLGKAKAFYDKFASALRAADESGYGVVLPGEEDLSLEPPEAIRQGGRSALRLKARAGSYHLIRVEVESEAVPVIGDAARSEEIVRGMLEQYEKDADGLWNTELFGRTFKDMVREGLDVRAGSMPEEVRKKMRRTIRRIVNEGRGGVICILL